MVKRQGKGNKVGFGVIFITACFVSAYILMEYQDEILPMVIAAVVLILSSFFFMNALFSDKAQELVSPAEKTEKTDSENGTDGEFRLKITKHMKDMENTQKELLAAVKLQNTALQSQIENLEQEIYMLSEKQMVQTKTLIKYNKENARQLAISERETLEHVLQELTKALEKNIGQMTVQYVAPEVVPDSAMSTESPTAEPIMEEYAAAMPEAEEESVLSMEEIPEGELFAVEEFPDDEELGQPDLMALLDSMEEPEEILEGDIEASDSLVMEDMEIPEIPVMEDMEIPDIPAMEDMEISDIPVMEDVEIPDIPVMEDMEIPDIPVMEDVEIPDIPVMEDVEIPDIPVLEDTEVSEVPEEIISEPEPVKTPEPVASDSNAMMTPEDIARLLESMGV